MASSFVPSTAGIHHLLHAPNSIVGEWLKVKGDEVRIAAEQLAPVGDGKDGHLARSIERQGPYPTSDGQAVRVGSRKRYAAAVVMGTKERTIEPKNVSFLRFEGNDGPVFTKLVHHRPTTGNNFLMRAARRVIRGGGA